jgi:segregation and condensation protein B
MKILATPDLVALVEALVFAAERPLSAAQLAEILEVGQADVVGALDELSASCDRQQRGVFLQQVAGGFQLRTRPEYADFLRKLGRRRPFRFSRAAMETLAIIAYRQPITRPEIEYLRGVDSGSVLKTLMEKHLVRILGKKDVPGKPMIYGTTAEFLELFGLADLASLPTLREFSELSEEAGLNGAPDALRISSPEEADLVGSDGFSSAH